MLQHQLRAREGVGGGNTDMAPTKARAARWQHRHGASEGVKGG